jgi:hypothetical protein
MARHLTSLEHYHNKYILGIEGEIGSLSKLINFNETINSEKGQGIKTANTSWVSKEIYVC